MEFDICLSEIRLSGLGQIRINSLQDGTDRITKEIHHDYEEQTNRCGVRRLRGMLERSAQIHSDSFRNDGLCCVFLWPELL